MTVPEAERENGSRRRRRRRALARRRSRGPGKRPVTRPGSKARTRSKHSGAPAHPPASEPTPVADDATLEVPDVLEGRRPLPRLVQQLCGAATGQDRRVPAASGHGARALPRRAGAPQPIRLATWLSNGARAAAPPHAFVKGGGDRSAASRCTGRVGRLCVRVRGPASRPATFVASQAQHAALSRLGLAGPGADATPATDAAFPNTPEPPGQPEAGTSVVSSLTIRSPSCSRARGHRAT